MLRTKGELSQLRTGYCTSAQPVARCGMMMQSHKVDDCHGASGALTVDNCRMMTVPIIRSTLH